jgi:hypothetical protein
MVFLMRHIQVNNGKRHENERLKRHNQNMENGPPQGKDDLRAEQQRAAE